MENDPTTGIQTPELPQDSRVAERRPVYIGVSHTHVREQPSRLGSIENYVFIDDKSLITLPQAYSLFIF